MRIAIGLNGSSDHTTRRFAGLTKYLVEPRGSFFSADVPLSSELERAINLTQPIWGTYSNFPMFGIDSGNHGWDSGLVLLSGKYIGNSAGNIDGEVVVRVSFGGSRENLVEFDKRTPDNSPNQRIHVSVYGFRMFLPVSYEQLSPLDRFSRDLSNEHSAVQEEVHVSLRWLAGRYDDWSDPKQWVADSESMILGKKEPHDHRTTYAVSSIDRNITYETPSESGTLQGIAAIKAAEERIAQYGRKPNAIPLNRVVNDTLIGLQIPDFEVNKYRLLKLAPVVGYERITPMIGLPVKTDEEIKKMTPLQGIEFLFGEILPAVESFVRR